MFYKHLFFIKQYIQKHLAILAAPLVLVLVLSLLPEAAHAGTLGSILSALTYIPLSFAYLILALVTLLSGLVAELCGAFLNWITGPAFITLKYTNNEFVNLGLGITKNFVNLILVVFLIYIALAIALRLKERATKQTLVYLIIIALLVNFAPVFCGLIVDATNIVQNYFLAGIQKGVSGIVTDSLSFSDLGKTANTISDDWAAKLGIFTKLLLIIIMNISIAFALLLFAAIFFFRLIAIWILVILSPLAFVAWILPATKKFWTLWWNQFIQWSIIGIPLAFFLYLVMATTTVLNNTFRAKMTLPGISTDTVGLLNMVLPYIAITALLYFGFVIGLKTSAMGASSAIKMTKGLGKWTGRKTLQQTAGRFFASERGKKFVTAKLPEGKSRFGKIAYSAIGAVGTATGARWAARGIQRVGAVYGAQQSKVVEDEKKKIKEQFGNDYERAAATAGTILPGNFHKKIAMNQYLAETKGGKGLKELGDSRLREYTGLTARYAPHLIENVVKYNRKLIDDEKIGPEIQRILVPGELSKDKDLINLVDNGIITEEINTKKGKAAAIRKVAIKKIVSKLKSEDIDKLGDDDFEDEIFKQMIGLCKPWNFIDKIGTEKGLNYIEDIQKEIEKNWQAVAKLNPTVLRAAYTIGGQALLRNYVINGKEITKIKEINEIIKSSATKKQKEAEQPGKIIWDKELAEKKEQAQKEYEKKQKEQEEQKQKESPKPKKPGLTGEGSGYVGGGAP